MKHSKTGIFLFFVAMFALLSCKRPKPVTVVALVDTLRYTMKTVEERATDCGNKPDSGCTVATIKYPVFANQPELNDTLTNKLIRQYNIGNAPASSITRLAKNFIAFYQQEKDSADFKQFEFTCETEVLRHDSSLTAIQLHCSYFVGSAHGHDEYTYFINWDNQAKRNLQLSDIFKNGYEATLRLLAEQAFRKLEHIGEKESLSDYSGYSHVVNGKVTLTNNFSISNQGIYLLYNEYELEPYTEGPTILLIPYAQIKSLLRPGTVVSQYIK